MTRGPRSRVPVARTDPMEPIRLPTLATVWRRTQPVPVTWVYEATDPYAVTLSIRAGRGWRDWTFCRELLATGLLMPAGRGDILLEPAPGDTLRLELRSPNGHTVLAVTAAEAHRFLAQTYQQVRPGQERGHLGLDGELTELCTGGFS